MPQPANSPPPPPPAQYAPAPVAESSSLPDEGLQLRAGVGIARYRENLTMGGRAVEFAADLEPLLQIGGEGAWSIGRGQLVLDGQVSIGTEVSMTATVSGMVTQSNKFAQQIYEGSPRLRWPVTPSLYVEAGYRLTYQRLFIRDVANIGNVEEDVTVHAVEGGAAWHGTYADGGTLLVSAGVGINHGSADNSYIQGGNFTASGHSFWLRGERRLPSQLGVGISFAYRQQDGSDYKNVTIMGVPGMAVWPQNTTWTLLVVVSRLW
jgi:hypothetical protein